MGINYPCVDSAEVFLLCHGAFYCRHPATVTVIEISAVIGIVVWAAGYRLIRVSKGKEQSKFTRGTIHF